MFQYTAAKSLASQLGVPFKLEAITSLSKDRKRSLALSALDCRFDLASLSDVRKFIHFPALYRHRPSLFSKFGKNIYRESSFAFNKDFFQIKSPIYLDGFWQSPKYFSEIAPTLKEEFSVRKELLADLKITPEEMLKSESVAIHIRRGDFLNPKAADFHGFPGVEYYSRAITLFKERIPEPRFFYFTDDVKWVEENIVPMNEGKVVSAITGSSIHDFYLMTKCKHNIIANSSFSWWTAWLNNNSEKIVIAPVNWFADKSIDTSDLMPDGWIRV